jgi:16S rRNA (cytosine967-C5)-methyltransferase
MANSDSAGIESRALALDLLAAVLGRHRTLDDVFADNLHVARFELRDRAFIRLLLATTLRRLGQIDAVIQHCLTRDLPRKGMPQSTPRSPWRRGAVNSITRDWSTPFCAALPTKADI